MQKPPRVLDISNVDAHLHYNIHSKKKVVERT